MGGWISLKFASSSPERVDRLVLVASAGMRFEPPADLKILYPETRDDLQGMLRVLSQPTPPAFLQNDILRYMKQQGWVVRRAVDSMLTARDVLDGQLGRVSMPVLLIWGANDQLIPLSVAHNMQKEMPQAQLHTIEGCGHLVPVECAGQVLPIIEKFLF